MKQRNLIIIIVGIILIGLLIISGVSHYDFNAASDDNSNNHINIIDYQQQDNDDTPSSTEPSEPIEPSDVEEETINSPTNGNNS